MAKHKSTHRKLVPATRAVVPSDYAAFLADLKARVRSAQLKAAVSVNTELIRLYWDIGRAIIERQRRYGWGKAVVDRLAGDLQAAFPGQAGFSPRNVWRMRALFVAYSSDSPAEPILPQPVAEIPWGHNSTILERVKDPAARLWYARATTEYGWSRAVLDHQIDTDAYGRKGQAVSRNRRDCHTVVPAAIRPIRPRQRLRFSVDSAVRRRVE